VTHGIDAGTASRTAGTVGTLQAPLATMSVRQHRSPVLVAMWYPASVRLTDVTVVRGRTGASDTIA
jgi:hypothetical protein